MKFSENQKIELRNKAKSELERIEKIYANQSSRKLIDEFKNKFLMCERTYKIILKEHQRYKGNDIADKNLKISMTQAPHALNFAGYNFNKDLLTRLFSSEDHVGRKSAKTIRNALTHNPNNSDVEELETRKEELFKYMNEFLEKIRSYDQKKIA